MGAICSGECALRKSYDLDMTLFNHWQKSKHVPNAICVYSEEGGISSHDCAV